MLKGALSTEVEGGDAAIEIASVDRTASQADGAVEDDKIQPLVVGGIQRGGGARSALRGDVNQKGFRHWEERYGGVDRRGCAKRAETGAFVDRRGTVASPTVVVPGAEVSWVPG